MLGRPCAEVRKGKEKVKNEEPLCQAALKKSHAHRCYFEVTHQWKAG